MKHHIENAEMDKIKCLSFDCQKAMSKAKVKSILKSQGEDALFDKYERFLEKRALETDMNVRYCPKAGCEGWMRAENSSVKKLTCPTCSTDVCFLCKDVWHGNYVTCQEAMTKELKEWASNVGGNISFCPCCRTKIEKAMGCNHMTCWFCQYEFCWCCGESASYGSDHF